MVFIIFRIFPLFFLSLLVWLLVPYLSSFISFHLDLLFFLGLYCTILGVYIVIISGWSSNYDYSLLGSLPALAETISYEVGLAFIFISFVVLICRYNFSYLMFIAPCIIVIFEE